MTQSRSGLILAGTIFLLAVITNTQAASYEDKDNHFKITYGDDWQVNTAISATVKYSLVSVKRASSGRPSASIKVEVSGIEDSIPLQKYIKNSIGVASSQWKILEEKKQESLNADNVFLKLERKIGSHSKKVQKLFVKAKGNVYEVTCSMSKVADSEFESACTNVLNSFSLL